MMAVTTNYPNNTRYYSICLIISINSENQVYYNMYLIARNYELAPTAHPWSWCCHLIT